VGGVELLVGGAECGEGAVDGRRRLRGGWAVGAVGADGAAVVAKS